MDRNLYIKIRCYFMMNARKRTRYLIKKKIFRHVGKDFVFFPRKIPQDPQFLSFGDNVVVATDVMFVNHDIIHEMFNADPKEIKKGRTYFKNWGCTEVKDNVFIGAKSLIMPGITLGPDVVVAGGSVVTKNFSGGVIIGGNPAKVIGSIDDLKEKRYADTKRRKREYTKDEEARRAWLRFSDNTFPGK